jgi:hypothetical protein
VTGAPSICDTTQIQAKKTRAAAVIPRDTKRTVLPSIRLMKNNILRLDLVGKRTDIAHAQTIPIDRSLFLFIDTTANEASATTGLLCCTADSLLLTPFRSLDSRAREYPGYSS